MGDSYVFTLDFEPSGNMRVTIADEEGEPATWPGIFHTDPALDLQLPIPPSWWAAVAIETDYAPESGPGPIVVDGLAEVFGLGSGIWLFGSDLYVRLHSGPTNGLSILYRTNYEKLGRNRGVITIRFDLEDETRSENLDEFQKGVYGSTWVFDLVFTSDGAARYTLTATKEGQVPLVKQGFVDFNGNSINLNEFPEEVLPPIAPPQASGTDVSGVEIAAAVSASQISGDDVQTFLINDQGVQTAAYQPGDWLEPKDGSKQRMMIVGVSQGTSAASPASRQTVQAITLRYAPAFPSPVVAEQAVFHGMPTFQPVRFAPFTTSAFYSPLVVSASYALASESTIIQLSVVCMQKNNGIPTRGARYFSQSKAAEGPVQTCQRDCVLNETSNIQECVWKCEEN